MNKNEPCGLSIEFYDSLYQHADLAQVNEALLVARGMVYITGQTTRLWYFSASNNGMRTTGL